MQLKRYIKPADLDTLFQSSDPLRDLSMVRELPVEGPQRERVIVEMQSPIAPQAKCVKMEKKKRLRAYL
jgi:hypothetical protein